MRPVRVLHLVWRLSVAGGIQRLVRDMASSLDRERVELHVLSIRPSYPEDRVDEVLPPGRFHSVNQDIGRSRLMHLRAAARATGVIRDLSPDVVHLHSGTAWLGLPGVVFTRSARRLLEVHDAPQSGRSGGLNTALSRLAVRRLGCEVLVNSTDVRKQTAAAFGISPRDIHLLPLGVDTNAFAPDSRARQRERDRLGLGPHQPLVVWVGRLEPMKRPFDAVDVAREIGLGHPDCVVAIVGNGSLQANLGEATEGDENLRVLGHVDDLPGLLNAADVFLSTAAYEGFGLAVAEAMACGLPVVATRVGGLIDVVADDVTGFLTPVGDVHAASGRVSELLSSLGRRTTMGAHGRRRVEGLFTTARMAEAYTALYEGGATQSMRHSTGSATTRDPGRRP